jgi:ketosteroid isomerase-like protein
MTSNVDRVRRSLLAMEQGDVDAIAAQAHPDVEFVNPPYALEPGTRHGIEGFKTGLSNMLEAFEELRFESQRVVDLGDRVVAVGRWTGRGRGSSYKFEPQPYAFLATLREGQIIRYQWFAEPQEAFAAAGISDPDPNPG